MPDENTMAELRVAAPLSMCAPSWFDSFIWKVEGLAGKKHKAGLDHERHFKNVALFQPYHANGKELLILLDACERAGLVIDFSGVSRYWPGTTFRIAIYRPEDAQQFREYVALTKNAEITVPMEDDQLD